MIRRHRALPLLALLLSVALHGAGLAWLLVADPELQPTRRPQPAPLQVDITVVERAAPAPPPPPPPPRRRAGATTAPRPAAPAQPARPEAPAAPPSVAADAPTRGPSLRERLFLVPAPTPTPGQDPAGTGTAQAPPRAPTTEERVEQSLRMGVAARKARDGFVHTYFTQVLQDALTAAWRAKRTHERRGGRGDKACEAQLHLRQAADGSLLDVRVVYPSCDPLQDSELLDDLRIAARSLPAPPPEVLAGRPAVESIWRFRFQPPPPWSTTLEFDVVRLVDKRALPPPNPRKVLLVAADVGADAPGPARVGP